MLDVAGIVCGFIMFTTSSPSSTLPACRAFRMSRRHAFRMWGVQEALIGSPLQLFHLPPPREREGFVRGSGEVVLVPGPLGVSFDLQMGVLQGEHEMEG